MLPQKGATLILVVFTVAGALAEGSTPDRGTKKFEGTEAEARQDFDDNIAESSVTSYSSVVIHHTPGKSGEEGDVEPSRSESYFKVFNTHGKKFKDEEHFHKGQDHPVREEQYHRAQRPTRQEEPKIRHLESNFKPVENIRHESKQTPRSVNLKHPTSTEGYKHESKYNRNRDHYRNEDYDRKGDKRREPKFESSFDDSRRPVYKHDGPEHRGHSDYRSDNHKNHKKATPPPGMTEELMETLLQQEPQKFGDGEKVKRYEPKKKFKNARESGNSFNVGYSIGFGQPLSDDVVLGRPKDVKLHVNGQKSVWKQLNENVEMSHDLDKKKPHSYRVPDSSPRGAAPQINVLKNGASSVFYMNNNSPDINNIPTEGKGTFDHNHALTQSNVFDFSNAMANPPLALPLQSTFVPESQPAFSLKPKGRAFDIMSLYQSMGYSPPIPVFIPDSKGEGQMIQAIVIPLQTLPNVDFNWGNFAGMYNNPVPQAAMNFNSFTPSHVPNLNAHHVSQSFHGPKFNLPKEKLRSPKSRKPKDSVKAGSSFSSSPIVVAPITHSHRTVDLQKEQAALNAILAKELSRKNQRHSPIGLRPPPAPHS